MPKAKIICTVGPASERAGVLVKMLPAGMDVVRLNFSHGNLARYRDQIRLIRKLDRKYHRRIKILGDLEGYRIRIGRLKRGEPVKVRRNQVIWLTREDILGAARLIPFDYQGSLSRIKKGQYIYIDDGNIALKVEACEKNRLKTRVMTPGLIKERKGINMPGVRLDLKGLTIKDKADIRFCAQNQVDYIAQSFVRSKDDILMIREYPKRCPHHFYGVPMVQKEIIKKCNRAKKRGRSPRYHSRPCGAVENTRVTTRPPHMRGDAAHRRLFC